MRRPVVWVYGKARRDSLVDPDDVLLDLNGLLVEEEVVGRRQQVLVYATAQLLDLFYNGGRDPKGHETLVGLAPEALVHNVRLPGASRSAPAPLRVVPGSVAL